MREGVLLLGGLGYIGSNIAQRLVMDEDYDVVIFDLPNSSTERVDSIKNRVTIYSGYLHDIDLVSHIVEKHNIKCVIHLVSNLLPNSTLRQYQDEIEIIIQPTISIIHFCAERQIKFVFFSSGGTVYGENGNIIHSETESLVPISYYGLSKYHIETIIHIESRKNNLTYLIVRPSNPYGRGQRLYGKQGLIAVSIGKILKDEPIVLYGDGCNVRDYIYICDLTEYIYQLLKKDVKNEVFNIGSGVGYTNTEVIELIYKISRKEKKVIYEQSRSGDVRSVVLNIDKINHYVDLNQKTLEEGITLFYDKSTGKENS